MDKTEVWKAHCHNQLDKTLNDKSQVSHRECMRIDTGQTVWHSHRSRRGTMKTGTNGPHIVKTVAKFLVAVLIE